MNSRLFALPLPALSLRLRQGGVIALLLLAAAALGLAALSPGVALGVALLPLAAGGGLLFLRHPLLALCFLIIAAVLVPYGLSTGTQSQANVMVLLPPLLFALWLLRMVGEGSLRLVRSRTLLPLLLLQLSVLLSFGVGQLPRFLYAQQAPLTAQLGGSMVFFISAALFMLAAHQIQQLRHLALLIASFLGAALLAYLPRLLPTTVASTLPRLGGNEGSLFYIWLVALLFSLALFGPFQQRRWRLALLGFCLMVLISLLQNLPWSSGWIPALVAMAFVLLIALPTRGRIMVLLAGAVALAASWGLLQAQIASVEAYSLLSRLAAWRIMAELIAASPILGLGPANYYFYTPLYNILGWNVSFNSHNQYVDLLAQLGIVGFGCYLWFMAAMGRTIWRLRRTVPPGTARAFVYAAFGAWAAMLVAGMLGDWVLPFTYNIGWVGLRTSALGWLFLGAVVALEALYGAPPAAQASAPLGQGAPTLP